MTTNKAGAPAFALFETPIGVCGIVWRGETVAATALPDAVPGRTRTRLLARHPGAVESEPSPAIAALIAAIRDLLRGAAADFSSAALDFAGVSDFDRGVYQAALAIPLGRTVTYGEMAKSIGDPGAARAVGAALGRNPFPIIVPCHRILASGGKSGGFSAPGGTATKFRILQIERAGTGSDGGLFGHLPLAVKP